MPVTTEQSREDTELIAVRRRSRRRRSRRVAEQQASYKKLAIIGSFLGFAILLTIIPSVRRGISGFAKHSLKLNLGADSAIYIAVTIAAIALIFLIPAVEDRVLRLLGIRKTKKPPTFQRK
jgi:hypothetical protein